MITPAARPTTRPLLCLLLLLLLLGISAGTAASQPNLVQAFDLSLDSGRARQENRVILLLVSQHHCPFCHQLKRRILQPMIASGDYRDELLIRELFIDTGNRIRDFAGSMVDAADFAHGYGVDLTPTLLFLAPDGRELTERLIGIQTPEFFYYYVDQSVQQAIAALGDAALPSSPAGPQGVVK